MLMLMSTATFTLSAQKFHLPKNHTSQHKDLLANQRPMSAKAKADANRKLMEEMKRREALDNAEVFGQYWESERVNPYGNITIPETANINVSGFVTPVKSKVTSPYGWRARFGRMHRGVDLSLRVGDTVRCAFSGKVRLTKYEGKGYGYYVVVRHDNGMETVYGHLSKFIAKPNQRVRAGEPIALGGSTGRSTGPHLHFETRYYGMAINPALIIDFENGVPYKDVYTFNKSAVEKSNVTRRYAKKSRSKSRSTASRSRTRKK